MFLTTVAYAVVFDYKGLVGYTFPYGQKQLLMVGSGNTVLFLVSALGTVTAMHLRPANPSRR